jgi:cob(I)alamin adenosyltransferase
MTRRKKNLFVETAIDPDEDLALVGLLLEDPKWEALKRCLVRYNRAIAYSSFRLNMSTPAHRYAHAAYGGQGEALKYIVKFVEMANKKLKEKEKSKQENGLTKPTNKY